MRRRLLATLATALSPLLAAPPAGAEDGDVARGGRVFQHCYACHSVKPEERGLPGPNLAGVVGRPAAALPDFDYSPAMAALGASGLVWSEAALDRYLADPETAVPGTWMAVNGLESARDRADVIAYLRANGE